MKESVFDFNFPIKGWYELDGLGVVVYHSHLILYTTTKNKTALLKQEVCVRLDSMKVCWVLVYRESC